MRHKLGRAIVHRHKKVIFLLVKTILVRRVSLGRLQRAVHTYGSIMGGIREDRRMMKKLDGIYWCQKYPVPRP